MTEEKVKIISTILGLLQDLLKLQTSVQGYFERGEGAGFMRNLKEILEVKK